MKSSVPSTAKIAKDAKECVQECVSEFISFITSEAAEKCQLEKRKTIGGEDILYAMSTLGFDQYAETLKIHLAKLRAVSAFLWFGFLWYWLLILLSPVPSSTTPDNAFIGPTFTIAICVAGHTRLFTHTRCGLLSMPPTVPFPLLVYSHRRNRVHARTRHHSYGSFLLHSDGMRTYA